MSPPLVARAELTSTDTSASVWSITTAPPEGSDTWREYARLDLVLDLEAREERDVVAVELHPLDVVGHDVAHERYACS